MPAEWRYRGRVVTAEDVTFIRDLSPHIQRAGDGYLRSCARPGTGSRPTARRATWSAAASVDARPGRRDPVAAGAYTPPNPLCGANGRAVADRQHADQRPAGGSSARSSQQVRRTADEPLFNSLMEPHHYLGYEQPVGEHLKYLVWAQGRPIACLAWSSAPRHLGSRDRFIGWSGEARRRNIRFLAYNTRFLILPWVQVPHLASHLLGRMARRLSQDWERLYGHPIYFLETFVDPERFRGTCYRAANWVVLGQNHGAGQGRSDAPAEPVASKRCWGFPLTGGFASYYRRRKHEVARSRERSAIDVSTEELEALLEQARREPLREDGYQKLRAAIRTLGYVTELLEKKETTLAALRELLCPATTEKTDKVLKQAGIDRGEKKPESRSEEAEGNGCRTRAQRRGGV